MKITLEKYIDAQKRLPAGGHHILGFQEDEQIVVYQAYNARIARSAVERQFLGGAGFSYNRMSWIKPNFLWMMYRCGWAAKPDQERVLAIWITKDDFEEILGQGVFSSYMPQVYANRELWQEELGRKNVRLQWDPDHDPGGGKLERRAIQVGLKNQALEDFGRHQIKRIEDVTDYVLEQKKNIDAGRLSELMVPYETIFRPVQTELGSKIGIDQ